MVTKIINFHDGREDPLSALVQYQYLPGGCFLGSIFRRRPANALPGLPLCRIEMQHFNNHIYDAMDYEWGWREGEGEVRC